MGLFQDHQVTVCSGRLKQQEEKRKETGEAGMAWDRDRRSGEEGSGLNSALYKLCALGQ